LRKATSPSKYRGTRSITPKKTIDAFESAQNFVQ
jgi:hypothetical protein